MRKRKNNELLGIFLYTSVTKRILIEEQKANEPNPLYSLANTTQHTTPRYTVRQGFSTYQASRAATANTGESIIK
jgi:hypothetical protein